MHDIYANQNEGYEERDIVKSIIKHNLENDPTYLAVKEAKDKEWQEIIDKRSAALAEMKNKVLESKKDAEKV
jgi:hypothetical protein